MLWKVKYHPFLLERWGWFFHSVLLGVQIRGGGSISASGFGPGGPNPGGPNLLGHRHDNGANRIQEQMDLEMTFKHFIKRNDLTAKESWQIRCHIIFFQIRWPKPIPKQISRILNAGEKLIANFHLNTIISIDLHWSGEKLLVFYWLIVFE